MPIAPNTWYEVEATFETTGPLLGDNSVAGIASLVVNGAPAVTESVVLTEFGDTLGRKIGVGTFSVGSGILNLSGNLYDPKVSLLVPEPCAATLMLSLLGGVAAFARYRKQ